MRMKEEERKQKRKTIKRKKADHSTLDGVEYMREKKI